MSKAAELIPASVQAFAEEFVALAKKHGLHQASINLSFGYMRDRACDEPVSIVWEAGRHGEDAQRFSISTTLRLSRDLRKEADDARRLALTKQEGGKDV